MNMSERTHDWLLANKYPEEAAKIETILKKWKKNGIRTRRNWWSVIAGTKAGNSVNVDGIDFLVIKAARDRMGLSFSANAVSKSPNESAPKIEKQGRWKGIPKKKGKKKPL
jgi:hypothetical protein